MFIKQKIRQTVNKYEDKNIHIHLVIIVQINSEYKQNFVIRNVFDLNLPMQIVTPEGLYAPVEQEMGSPLLYGHEKPPGQGKQEV